MWKAVTPRFSAFLNNVHPTPEQTSDALAKAEGVTASLNRAYYDRSDVPNRAAIVGSWAKKTVARPSSDIDLYYFIPDEEFRRFDEYVGNGQSALLQDVKNKLTITYPQTGMRGDGQVVVVAFNTITVEVSPVYRHLDNSFLVPYTENGGRWNTAMPLKEIEALDISDMFYNSNARKLLRLLKVWKRHRSVAIKSFHVELVLHEFLAQSPWAKNSLFYYDWLIRDFFVFLMGKANGYVFVPGTNELLMLGDLWLSKAKTSHAISLVACEREYKDEIVSAGYEWQKLFGEQIPVFPI